MFNVLMKQKISCSDYGFVGGTLKMKVEHLFHFFISIVIYEIFRLVCYANYTISEVIVHNELS